MASANSWAISASVRTTSTFIFGLTSFIAEPHDLHAGIHKQDIPGHPPSQVAGQKHRGIGHLAGSGHGAAARALALQNRTKSP